MLFNTDWDKCKARFDAFWDRDMLDRCCIQVTAPRTKPLKCDVEAREPKDLQEKWTDIGFRYNQFLCHISRTYFGGDAFPNFWVNLGPGVVASLMGSPYLLSENTVWFDSDPVIKDWNAVPELKLKQTVICGKLPAI